MLETVRNHSNYSNKIQIPGNTAVCQIATFIPIESLYVEKLRFTKININKFSQVCLK